MFVYVCTTIDFWTFWNLPPELNDPSPGQSVWPRAKPHQDTFLCRKFPSVKLCQKFAQTPTYTLTSTRFREFFFFRGRLAGQTFAVKVQLATARHRFWKPTAIGHPWRAWLRPVLSNPTALVVDVNVVPLWHPSCPPGGGWLETATYQPTDRLLIIIPRALLLANALAPVVVVVNSSGAEQPWPGPFT